MYQRSSALFGTGVGSALTSKALGVAQAIDVVVLKAARRGPDIRRAILRGFPHLVGHGLGISDDAEPAMMTRSPGVQQSEGFEPSHWTATEGASPTEEPRKTGWRGLERADSAVNSAVADVMAGEPVRRHEKTDLCVT